MANPVNARSSINSYFAPCHRTNRDVSDSEGVDEQYRPARKSGRSSMGPKRQTSLALGMAGGNRLGVRSTGDGPETEDKKSLVVSLKLPKNRLARLHWQDNESMGTDLQREKCQNSTVVSESLDTGNPKATAQSGYPVIVVEEPSRALPEKRNVHPFFKARSSSTQQKPKSIVDHSKQRPNAALWPNSEFVHVPSKESISDIRWVDHALPFARRKRRRLSSTEKDEDSSHHFLHCPSLYDFDDAQPEAHRKLILSANEVESLLNESTAYSSPAVRCKIREACKFNSFDHGKASQSLWSNDHVSDTPEGLLRTIPKLPVLQKWLWSFSRGNRGKTAADLKKSVNKLSAFSGRHRFENCAKVLEGVPLDGVLGIADDDNTASDDEDLPLEQGCNKCTAYNFAVLAGPNGSGKTCSIAALAASLGFEVIELNASSRRSGKDMLDALGEATQSRIISKGENKRSQNHDNSIIVVEEIDIVFEEDRNFWSGLHDLIRKSKRPVILTCSNIDYVLSEFLESGNILDSEKPDIDEALSYLQAVCLCEGHLIDAGELRKLLLRFDCDVRACLMNLQFWCQMGLYDAHGGFGWYPEREIQGQKRTISEHTFCIDLLAQKGSLEDEVAETITMDAMEPVFACFNDDAPPSETGTDSHAPSARSDRKNLETLCEYAETLSLVDIFVSNRHSSFDFDNGYTQQSGAQVTGHPVVPWLTARGSDLQHGDLDLASSTLTSLLNSLRAAQGVGRKIHDDIMHKINERIYMYPKRSLGIVDQRRPLEEFTFPVGVDSDSLCFNSIDGPVVNLASDVAPYVRVMARNDLLRTMNRDLEASQNTGTGRSTRTAVRALGQSASTAWGRQKRYLPIEPNVVLSTWNVKPR